MKGIRFLVVSILLLGLWEEVACGSLRERRQVDENQATLQAIKNGLVRLRHAEDRLRKFTDAIEDGLESGKVSAVLNDTEDKTPKGQVDFFKLVQGFKKHTPNSFEDLIKVVADDTHILLDQLYGRLDETGGLVVGAEDDENEKGSSAEMVHAGLKTSR